MSDALKEFEKMDKSEIKVKIEQLDALEQDIVKALDAQAEADVAFREFMESRNEQTGNRVVRTQKHADKLANAVDRAWNGFIYSLPWQVRQEFLLAQDATSFQALNNELNVAHKDLNRALSS